MKITIENIGNSRAVSGLFYLLGIPCALLIIGAFAMGVESLSELLTGILTGNLDGFASAISVCALLVGLLVIYSYFWRRLSDYVDQRMRFYTWKKAVEDAGLNSQARYDFQIALELYKTYPCSSVLHYIKNLNPAIAGVIEEEKVSIVELIGLVLGALSLIFTIHPILGVFFSIIGFVVTKGINKDCKSDVNKAGFICSVIGIVISIIVIACNFATKGKESTQSINMSDNKIHGENENFTNTLESTNQYIINEAGISIKLPKTYEVVLTRDIRENDPMLNVVGLTKEQVVNMMESSNCFLYVLGGNTWFIKVYMEDLNDYQSDYGGLSDENILEQQELINSMVVIVDDKMIITETSIYKNEEAKYVKVLYSTESKTDQSRLYCCEYIAQYNGKGMTVLLTSMGEEISSYLEEELQGIIDTIEFLPDFFEKANDIPTDS